MPHDTFFIGIMLFLCVTELQVDGASSIYMHQHKLDGYLSNTDVWYTETSRSIIDCTSTCETHKVNCASVFYVRNSGECKLHSVVFTSITGLTQEQSAEYLERVCPFGWSQFGRSCYQFYKVYGNFTEAASYCESIEAHVVFLESAEENAFVQEQSRIAAPAGEWFIGLVRKQTGYVWYGTNTPLGYADWGHEQPNNHDGEYCTVLQKWDESKWHDYSCSHKYYAICEKEI